MAKDLTGQRHWNLTVLEFVRKDSSHRTYWRCRCDCDNEIVTRSDHFTNGNRNTMSCGCLHKKLAGERATRLKRTHGQLPRRLFSIWMSMRSRCKYKGTRDGKNYADKGVRVCQDWHSYTVFRDWALSNGYREDLTIDRIDPSGNYEPSNCRWVTKSAQARNMRHSVYLEAFGRRQLLVEWAEEIGIDQSALRLRIKYNKIKRKPESIEQMLTRPLKNTNHRRNDVRN